MDPEKEVEYSLWSIMYEEDNLDETGEPYGYDCEERIMFLSQRSYDEDDDTGLSPTTGRHSRERR